MNDVAVLLKSAAKSLIPESYSRDIGSMDLRHVFAG